MKGNFEVAFSSKVAKFLKKLHSSDEKQLTIILESINEIKHNPYDSKPLKGEFTGKRRKREDPYRIIFQIDKKSNEIQILEIGKRKNIYKN